VANVKKRFYIYACGRCLKTMLIFLEFNCFYEKVIYRPFQSLGSWLSAFNVPLETAPFNTVTLI